VVTTPPSTWTPFFIVSLVGQVLGILLLGIATLRARVFPRWIGWLLIATLVLGVVSHLPFIPEALQSLSAIIASVAIAGFGYSLLWPERLERTQPAPASVEAEMRA
jgi:membrane protein implicated in regulation of membrane protease activity